MDLRDDLNRIALAYPTPLARSCEKLDPEGDPAEVHKGLLGMMEIGVCYLSMLAWSEYRAGGATSEAVEKLAARDKPTLGMRLELLRILDRQQPSSILRLGLADGVDPKVLPAAATWVRVWGEVKRNYGLINHEKAEGFLESQLKSGNLRKVSLDDFWGTVVECRNADAHEKLGPERYEPGKGFQTS